MGIPFTVYAPLLEHDEDAEPYANDHMAVVCDGLGGSGQNTYIFKGEKWSSAALGSRVVSRLFCNYFREKYYEIFSDHALTNEISSQIVKAFKISLKENMNEFVKTNNIRNVVKGKSMQTLPTTLAGMLYRQQDEYTEIFVVSAGDSRVYCLTPDKGLQQLSIDDVDDEKDAFQKATTMTNNISQDCEFIIHYGYFKLPRKCVVFAASDGCFDALENPMELEFMVECAIANSKNVLETENGLGKELTEKEIKCRKLNTKDDCTIAGCIFGYSNSKEFSDLFFERGTYVQNEYVISLRKIEWQLSFSKSSLEDKIDKYNLQEQELKKKISSKILSVLRKAVEADFTKHANSRDVAETLAFLAHDKEYHSYKQSLIEECKKVQVQKNELQGKYDSLSPELMELFIEVDVEKYMSSVPITYTSGLSLPKIISKPFQKIMDSIKRNRDEYDKSYTELQACLENTNRIVKGKKINSEYLGKLSILFSKYILSCTSIQEAEDNYSKQIRNAESDYRHNANFEALYKSSEVHAFSEYRGFTSYDKFYKTYNNQKKMKSDLDACKPMSNREMMQKCISFVENNFENFLSKIKMDKQLFRVIVGELSKEASELTKKREQTEAELRSISDSKLNYWKRYRIDYELFKKGILKGVV